MSISTTASGGTSTTLADNISYEPFGPLKGMDYADGHNLTIDYDLNYRATRLLRMGAGGSLMDIDFDYDEAGNILALNDNVRPDRSQNFAYDKISRLTDADGSYGSIDYAYNLGGDRESRDWTKDGITLNEDYEYDSATARLQKVLATDNVQTMTPIRDFAYEDSGQMNSDTRTASDGSTNTYDYGINARGRMKTISLNGAEVASYTYDESEQRIIKAVNDNGTTVTTHYHYDLEGRLIAETDASGVTQREYVWLGLMPVAIINGNGTLYYLHADHLGRPQFATISNGTVVIDIGEDVTPFGDGINFAAAAVQKLMFPGQYADVETGEDITLSHNWHRTYDPTLGRYLQADPIGLAGGLNRYAYVGGNPNSYVDPNGLDYVPPGVEGHGSYYPLRGQPVWYVVDLPGKNEFGETVECRCDDTPSPDDDVDFFLNNGEWTKILTGDVFSNGGGNYTSNPARVFRLRNRVSIPSTFPAKKPPSLYTLNNTPDYIGGRQSPWRYLKSIKKNISTCKNIPLN